MFKWGVANELIPASVHHALLAVGGLRLGRCQARESEPVRPVPVEHVNAVLPHVSPQVAAMVRLQLLTGMRPGEVVVMRRRRPVLRRAGLAARVPSPGHEGELRR